MKSDKIVVTIKHIEEEKVECYPPHSKYRLRVNIAILTFSTVLWLGLGTFLNSMFFYLLDSMKNLGETDFRWMIVMEVIGNLAILAWMCLPVKQLISDWKKGYHWNVYLERKENGGA